MSFSNRLLKPLRAQSNLARLVLLASLSCGCVGLVLGVTGTFQKMPTKILIGYSLLSPSLCTGLLANHAAQEMSRRLTTATKDQRAIDQQVKAAWKEGHQAGRTETLSEMERRPEPKPITLAKTINSPQSPDRTQEIEQLQSQLKAVQFELSRTIANHAQAIEDKNQNIAQLQRRLAKIDEETQHLEILKSNLEMEAQQLLSNKENQHHRELVLARGEAQSQLMQSQLAERDRKQDELERQIQQLNEEYTEALIQEQREGFEQGLNHATAQYSVQVERQQATIEKLSARLDKLNAYAALNKSIPSFDAAIGGKSKKRKPTFLCGSQGSGKALHCAALCQAYASDKSGVIPFVLDISEGGEASSSWARMNFPCTDNVNLFVSVLMQVVHRIESKQLKLRNDEGFVDVPAIVLIIDECLTAFNGLPSETVNAIANAIEIIETQGDKRKVYIVLCGQDNQIQNTSVRPEKGSPIKLVNTGKLRNYLTVHLNDSLLSRTGKDELQSNRELAQYLEHFGGSHFVGAVEWIDGKGKHLKPFKHVSHHGHLLNESKPSHIPSVDIADPPGWFPKKARELFPTSPNGETPNEAQTNPTDTLELPHQNLEALLSMNCIDRPIEDNNDPYNSVECPNCHHIGRHTVKDGSLKNRNVTRWKCKKCSKTFKSK